MFFYHAALDYNVARLIYPNIDDQEKPRKVCDCNMLRKGEIHPPFVPSGCRV